MKNEKFMLELFLGELRSNSSAIIASMNGPADVPMLENVARSLKTSARIVGFVELVGLFNALEQLFASGRALAPDETNAKECAEILRAITKSNPDEIEKLVDSMDARISACAKAGFTGRIAGALTDPKDHILPKLSPEETGNFESLPSVDASMKELFIADVSTQIDLISNTLVELGSDFNSKPKLEALMRASHSIKGASRAVGMDRIVEITHKMEDCFSAALKDKISLSDESLDVFFSCVDFLSQLCKRGFDRIDKNLFDSLMKSLGEVESSSEAGASLHGAGEQQPATASRPAQDNAKNSYAPGQKELNFIRISLSNINSIMSLAAEELIENRKLEGFKEIISNMRAENARISNRLEEALNMLSSPAGEHSAMARLERIGEDLRRQDFSFGDALERFSEYSRKNVLLSSRLYGEVLESRMRPFSDLAHIFPKMVRDFSRNLSKKITVEISGAATSIDRDLLEKLESPLVHILRNACDHGIETPGEREAAGKNPAGKISIRASHSSGMFLLTVSDDGRGIAVDKVKAKILERKLVPPDILAQMQQDEIFEFLFLPAFTTKTDVTEISGRGVGLDVVQTIMREVGGSVGVSSVSGRGCTFTLKLPITRSVLKALVVNVDSQPYAFPLSSVNRTLMVHRGDIRADLRGNFFMDNKSRINIVPTSAVLGFGQGLPADDLLYIVVLSGRGRFWGFAVDGIPEESELVVRALNTSLGKIACVSAAALTSEGLPILILDIDDILIYASRYLSGAKAELSEASPHRDFSKKRVLVVDDSATVREVEKKILEKAGFYVDTAVDGVDGWNVVRLSKYDLVVSDVDMPRMSGLGLAAKIRNLYPNLPVVMVSYKDRPEDKQRGLECGANAYLTKSSFQDDSFVKTLRSLLDK